MRAMQKLVFLFALIACAPGQRPDLPVSECTYSSDCAVGLICASGKCVPQCKADRDCSSAQVCSAGACVPAHTQCTSSAQCTAVQICSGGQCVSQCAADQDCGAGQRCDTGVCRELPAQCVRTSDCPAGKSCIAGSCADQCATSRDCAQGFACTSGSCTPVPPECIENTDCTGGKVCSPGGACVAACSSGATCASGETCSNGACVPSGGTFGALAGSATYAGLTTHSGIQVTLRGPNNASAVTDAAGAYGFAGLVSGHYVIRLTAPFSAEGAVEMEVVVRAATTTSAPAKTFSPVGEVKGVAHLADQSSHLNIQLFVAGTGRGASTATDGSFLIAGVPPGSRQIVATYPGYIAASVTVTVAFGVQTDVGTLTLQPIPAATGDSFAFFSVPPATARFGSPYVYTALAAGGGATVVTYSLEAGPPGMTIDASSGAVSFNPTAGVQFATSYIVAFAAHAGGAIVYQVYTLTILPLFQEVSGSFSSFNDADTAGGVTWAGRANAVNRFASSNSVLSAADDARNGAITSMSIVNGGRITGYRTPGGTITSFTAPVGTLSATWPGGTLASWTAADSVTVAGTRVDGGTFSAMRAQGQNTATAVSYTSAVATGFSATILPPTSVRADTGLVTAVTATLLTDSSGAWTTAAVGKCITNALNLTPRSFVITAVPAATQLQVISSSNLTTMLSPGHRYFVVDCSFGEMNFTLHRDGADFTGLVGRNVDLYLDGRYLDGDFVRAVATNEFTVRAGVALYQSIAALPTRGGYLMANASGYMVVRLTDSTASFGDLSSSYVAFERSSGWSQIIPFDATHFDFLVFPGTRIEQFVPGLRYMFTNVSGQIPITVTVASGLGSLTGSFLFVDAEGDAFPITANTSNTITVTVSLLYLPAMGNWVGQAVAVTNALGGPPVFIATVQGGGLVPGALVPKTLHQRVPSITLPWAQLGNISANSDTEITFQPNFTCFGNCPFLIRNTLAPAPGAEWIVTPPYLGLVNASTHFLVTVDAQGSPGWTVDALAGQRVYVERNLAIVATVVTNDAASLTLDARVLDFEAIRALVPGDRLLLSESGGTGSARYRVTLSDPGAAFTPNQWVGAQVVSASGRILGRVTSNTLNTVDVSVSDLSALSGVVGRPYAFSGPGLTMLCDGEVVVHAQLAGATLGTRYRFLITRSGNLFTVLANDTAEAQLSVCPSQFSLLIGSLGATAVLSESGSTYTATLVDGGASFTPGAFAGGHIYAGSSLQPLSVLSNEAQSLSLEGSAFSFDQIADFKTGARFVITDAADLLNFDVVTDAALVPNGLRDRFVVLHTTNEFLARSLRVVANDASSVTLRGYLFNVSSIFQGTAFDRLRTTAGAVLRISDAGATFTPGALRGRTVDVNFNSFTVVDNTATDLLLATSDIGALDRIRTATRYDLRGTLSGTQTMLALTNGEAWAGTTGAAAQLVRLGAAGVLERHHLLSAARALSVTPAPVVSGIWNNVTRNGLFSTLAVTGTAWTNGEHVGANVSVQISDSTNWETFPVVANTSNTLTVYTAIDSISTTSPKTYLLDPMRLVVTGAALTPGELRGARLWIDGTIFAVRDNDAGSLRVHRLQSSNDIEVPGLVQPGGGTAYVLSTLEGASVSGLALDSSGRLWAATQRGLVSMLSGAWSSYGEAQTSGIVASGTVGSFDDVGITAASGSFATNVLAGRRLRLASGIYTIASNTAQRIVLSSPFTSAAPPNPGEPFDVLDGQGLTLANDVAAAGNTIWAATSSGLVRRQAGNSAWERLTVASTESAPGAADGLPSNFVRAVAVRNGTDLWVATTAAGTARLSGTTWTQFNVKNTESAPGKADRLPSDSVFEFAFRGAEVWFATDQGPASLSGSTWSRPDFSFSSVSRSTTDVAFPGSEIWFVTANGIWRTPP